jgi:succinate dehydrogenase/fumarate reductase flavoprotein subunit
MSKQRRTSRRDFLKGVGVAATGAAASAALSGCSNSDCNCGDAQTLATGNTDAGCPSSGLGDAGGTQSQTTSGAGSGSVGAGGAGSTQTQTQHNGDDAGCPPVTQCQTPAALPTDWKEEADVVILGTGFAGLATAINAFDLGAKVLILEKLSQAEEGGNSTVSGNAWWSPSNLQDAITYMKALCFGLTDDKCIETLAQEMSTINDCLSSVLGISIIPMPVLAPEYPELPGSGTVQCWMSSNLAGTLSGGALWQPFRDAVSTRGINVLYETPGVELIQDPSTREIKGVVAKKGGQRINIKAKRAVVLACGGFEFNFEMQGQFLEGWPVYCQGSPGNTGDGIMMAQKAGAARWHMNNALAHVGCIIIPDLDPIPIPASFPSNGYMLVDKFGARFMNEKREQRHGFGHKEILFFFDGLKQTFPRLPCYAVFDDTARRAGAVASGGGFMGWYGKRSTAYQWSSDNSAEVTKGWIKQGQTLAELATAFGADSNTLTTAVNKYNQFCSAGNDQDFGRPANSLQALSTPPYYAIPIYPLMYNTMGGPRRNEKCQIIDPFSQAIPRLYSAGEMGSFWGWMYNGGGNNCECMCTGRVAGKNATAEAPWA